MTSDRSLTRWKRFFKKLKIKTTAPTGVHDRLIAPVLSYVTVPTDVSYINRSYRLANFYFATVPGPDISRTDKIQIRNLVSVTGNDMIVAHGPPSPDTQLTHVYPHPQTGRPCRRTVRLAIGAHERLVLLDEQRMKTMTSALKRRVYTGAMEDPLLQKAFTDSRFPLTTQQAVVASIVILIGVYFYLINGSASPTMLQQIRGYLFHLQITSGMQVQRSKSTGPIVIWVTPTPSPTANYSIPARPGRPPILVLIPHPLPHRHHRLEHRTQRRRSRRHRRPDRRL